MREQDKSVDGDIHRNYFGLELAIADHRPNDSFAGPNEDARGTVHVVHPARQGLSQSRRHWRSKEDVR